MSPQHRARRASPVGRHRYGGASDPRWHRRAPQHRSSTARPRSHPRDAPWRRTRPDDAADGRTERLHRHAVASERQRQLRRADDRIELHAGEQWCDHEHAHLGRQRAEVAGLQSLGHGDAGVRQPAERDDGAQVGSLVPRRCHQCLLIALHDLHAEGSGHAGGRIGVELLVPARRDGRVERGGRPVRVAVARRGEHRRRRRDVVGRVEHVGRARRRTGPATPDRTTRRVPRRAPAARRRDGPERRRCRPGRARPSRDRSAGNRTCRAPGGRGWRAPATGSRRRDRWRTASGGTRAVRPAPCRVPATTPGLVLQLGRRPARIVDRPRTSARRTRCSRSAGRAAGRT